MRYFPTKFEVNNGKFLPCEIRFDHAVSDDYDEQLFEVSIDSTEVYFTIDCLKSLVDAAEELLMQKNYAYPKTSKELISTLVKTTRSN